MIRNLQKEGNVFSLTALIKRAYSMPTFTRARTRSCKMHSLLKSARAFAHVRSGRVRFWCLADRPATCRPCTSCTCTRKHKSTHPCSCTVRLGAILVSRKRPSNLQALYSSMPGGKSQETPAEEEQLQQKSQKRPRVDGDRELLSSNKLMRTGGSSSNLAAPHGGGEESSTSETGEEGEDGGEAAMSEKQQVGRAFLCVSPDRF